MNNNYTVYKHTAPTGKVYIGITENSPAQRWAGGFGYTSNKPFFSDIVKYGWDNFRHEILFENLSKLDAEIKEIELIEQYHSIDCDYGYNQVEGVRGYRRPEHVRKKISKSMKTKAVVQYDLEGNEIQVFESMREAERQTSAKAGNISACCLGLTQTAGGFVWKYADASQDKVNLSQDSKCSS